MTSYLIVVNDIRHDHELLRSEAIIDFLLSREIWVFPSYAPHLKRLHPGDRLLVYLAAKVRGFIAEAYLASNAAHLEGELLSMIKELGLSWFDYFVHLQSIKMFPRVKSIAPLIPKLKFISDKKNYGLFLRQGVRRLDEHDARVILGRDSTP